jgi:regulator of cell morphogenesis and NO signaling
MSELDPRMSVGEIVSAHPACAKVFQAHRIDFCCGGGASVPEACARAGADAEAVLRELEDACRDRAGDPDLRGTATRALIAYVIDRHHAYLRKNLPLLLEMMAKVARVHGARNPTLVRLHGALRTLIDRLEPHIAWEEDVLFPALLRPLASVDRELVERELATMRDEHLAVAGTLRTIRELADDFTVPEWGCTTYRVLFGGLAELEGDIHRHVHIENLVLMPRFRSGRGSWDRSSAS